MERVEAGEAEPRLVPDEDQVRLDRKALFHDPRRVVHVPVERAVGQIHRAHLVERTLGGAVEERLLDGLQRHRAVHRVLGERERLHVVRLHAGEHEAVVMRLVAVTIDDDDVARLADRLDDDLVRRRRAVGPEERALGAKRARRHVLSLLDVAGRLEQAVEPTGGRRRFGEEDVGAVEVAHVADPVGPEHGLAARDRQRVEGADRARRVFLQVVEVRRLVAIVDAVHDRQVQSPSSLPRCGRSGGTGPPRRCRQAPRRHGRLADRDRARDDTA